MLLYHIIPILSLLLIIIILYWYVSLSLSLSLHDAFSVAQLGAQGPHLRDECEGPGAAQAAQEPWPVPMFWIPPQRLNIRQMVPTKCDKICVNHCI